MTALRGHLWREGRRLPQAQIGGLCLRTRPVFTAARRQLGASRSGRWVNKKELCYSKQPRPSQVAGPSQRMDSEKQRTKLAG